MDNQDSSKTMGPSLSMRFTLCIWTFIVLGLYLSSLYSYILFHAIVELFSIVIAFGVFTVAWNTRRLINNNYLLFIGIACFFIASIDLLHTLAYKGMDIFRRFDTDIASQLWISARYMEAISFLLGPFFFNRKLRPYKYFAVYLIVFICVIASIFYFRVFPDCFIEGKGLTGFKIISEYIISSILVVSIIILFRYRARFDKDVLVLIVWSLFLAIGSELFFTFYIDVYGLSNLIGHYFKLASFYFMYRAMIKIGLEKPYSLLLRELKINEDELKRHQNVLEKLVEERTNELMMTNEQLLKLSKKIGEAENIERQRLSRELHDTVGQNLTALGINLNILKSKLPPEVNDAIRLRVNDSLALVEETTESIRDVMAQLRPPVLDDYGLFAALRWYGGQFSARNNIDVIMEGEESDPRLNMYIEGALFRIAQEALNNVAKHSHAKKVTITLDVKDKKVLLSIQDNGSGFNPQNIADIGSAGKWGLTNIMERAASIGGRCYVDSSPGKGTKVTVEVTL